MQEEGGAGKSRYFRFMILVIAGILAVQIHWSILLLVGWYFILKQMETNGTLDKWNASRVLGVLLMIRTERGQRALDFISTPRKAWRIFGEIGLWTCRFVSAIVLILFTFTFISMILAPSEVPSASPSELLVIPGVTPTIPLFWGLIGLIVALVVHEYGHGILTRAHGMRVRHFGLLIVGLIPIGAFAEPEGRELLRAPRRERQRVFAAGPAVNIYGGFLCFLVLALVANTMTPAIAGVHAEGIIEDQPAAHAGLEPWEVITHANETEMNDYSKFATFLDLHRAGDNITLTVLSLPDEDDNREERNISLTLADHHQYLIEQGNDPAIIEAYGIHEGDAFLGVSGLSSNNRGAERLAGPLAHDAPSDPLSVAFGFAIQPVTIIFSPINFKGEIMHPNEADLLTTNSFIGTTGTSALLHLLFWVIWMNVLLGFANLIPLIPFDGGHLLKDRLHDYFSFFAKFSANSHPLKVEKTVNKISGISSLIILGMLMIIIILPLII
ncbi:MAG: site-2 protease family protein [Candidatus Thalassarchaeaceae archaeon]|nr:site-2 protease family protein [Candidatus Thalassarchaeaceae archaeon]